MEAYYFAASKLTNPLAFSIYVLLSSTYRLVLIFGVKMTALLDTTCADRILKAVYSMWRHIILQPVKLTNTLAFSIYVLLFST